MQDGVLVQESRRGAICVCPIWGPVVVGRDAERAGFVVRSSLLAPAHCRLTGAIDGTIRIAALPEAEVHVNGKRLAGEATVGPTDSVLLPPSKVQLKVVGLLDSRAPRRQQGALRLPQRLSEDLILLREVGRGAAGIVYEGFHREHGRTAVKLLIASGRAIPEVIERFKREADLQARLADYPGIVTVHDQGTLPDSGELYCLMEFVPGRTLRQRLAEGLPRLEGLRLMARIARAADYAHEHDLLHRDLKPSNVMISDRGVVRLTDFGLCKVLEDEEGLTATGVMLGTPCFMAPEQIEDSKRVEKSADIYSLGAVMYVILTSQLPFSGPSLRHVLDKVLSGQVTPPRQIDPTIDSELEAICLQCLDRTINRRPAAAIEIARRIEGWVKRVHPPEKVSLQIPNQDRRPG